MSVKEKLNSGLTAEEMKLADNIWPKLKSTCGVSHSFWDARIKFMNMVQLEHQTIDELYTESKSKATNIISLTQTNASLTGLSEASQTKSQRRQKRTCCREEKLTLENCLQTARKHESHAKQFSDFQTSTTKNGTAAVHAVKSKTKFYKNCYFCGKDQKKGNAPPMD